MYEYKFVKIELKSGLMASKPKEGWRFVQIFAPSTAGTGSAAYFELIFERKQTI
ncbi:protein of unknown function [Bacillus sp. 491mf]|uniref:DUF4177 domain-containing protein n=1 Tax=Bacillus TaxID=1386 RepID=UPI0008EF626D|nr:MULTISPECIES: DUF4177 domain-containing protein [unclassified Bacillus (in: firmicutes)]SFC63532.1 protein of unknown function [Bacillus sp. 491mf]